MGTASNVRCVALGKNTKFLGFGFLKMEIIPALLILYLVVGRKWKSSLKIIKPSKNVKTNISCAV